jgi:hypothetical protein
MYKLVIKKFSVGWKCNSSAKHLHRKYQTLSLNPGTAKKKKERKERNSLAYLLMIDHRPPILERFLSHI